MTQNILKKKKFISSWTFQYVFEGNLTTGTETETT